MRITIRRVYDVAEEPGAELRILVDRMWPRGVAKKDAAWDWWCKDVAPSAELRKWFGHDRTRWEEFQKRYFAELELSPQGVERLLRITEGYSSIEFLYAAKDNECNNAVALASYLTKKYHM